MSSLVNKNDYVQDERYEKNNGSQQNLSRKSILTALDPLLSHL